MATPAVNAADLTFVIGGEQREIEGAFDSPEYVDGCGHTRCSKG
jgi:hypothetical protein